jgi:hypothetical protein
MIYELMILLAQSIHLSCTDTNIVSKRTETRFHMTHVTQEFHQVCPKWFPSPWYIWPKPCTYLTSRLALSPNGLKWASRASQTRSATRCIQNDCWGYGTFSAKTFTYLAPTLTLSPNRPKWDSRWPMSPRSSIRCIQHCFRGHGTFGPNRAPILCQD